MAFMVEIVLAGEIFELIYCIYLNPDNVQIDVFRSDVKTHCLLLAVRSVQLHSILNVKIAIFIFLFIASIGITHTCFVL